MTKGTNKCIVEKVFFRKGGEKYFRMWCRSIDIVSEKYFVGSYVGRLKVQMKQRIKKWIFQKLESRLICLLSDIELVMYISETRKSIDMSTFGYRVGDVGRLTFWPKHILSVHMSIDWKSCRKYQMKQRRFEQPKSFRRYVGRPKIWPNDQRIYF